MEAVAQRSSSSKDLSISPKGSNEEMPASTSTPDLPAAKSAAKTQQVANNIGSQVENGAEITSPSSMPTTVSNLTGAEVVSANTPNLAVASNTVSEIEDKPKIPLLIGYRFEDREIPKEIQEHANKIYACLVRFDADASPQSRAAIAERLEQLAQSYNDWTNAEQRGIHTLLRDTAVRLRKPDNLNDYLNSARHGLDELVKMFPVPTNVQNAQIDGQLVIPDIAKPKLDKGIHDCYSAQELSKKLKACAEQIQSKNAQISQGDVQNISEQDKQVYQQLLLQVQNLAQDANPVVKSLSKRAEHTQSVYQAVQKLHHPGPESCVTTTVNGMFPKVVGEWRQQAKITQQKARHAECTKLSQASEALATQLSSTTQSLSELKATVYPNESGIVSSLKGAMGWLWSGAKPSVVPLTD